MARVIHFLLLSGDAAFYIYPIIYTYTNMYTYKNIYIRAPSMGNGGSGPKVYRRGAAQISIYMKSRGYIYIYIYTWRGIDR